MNPDLRKVAQLVKQISTNERTTRSVQLTKKVAPLGNASAMMGRMEFG